MPNPYHVYHLRSSVWQRYNAPVSNGPQLWVGATVTDSSGGNAISVVQAANSVIGPLFARRTFVTPQPVSTFPTDIAQTDAAADLTVGMHPFLSVKGDPAGMANGDYDGVLTQLALTFPTTSRCWLTHWHEPENDMTGATFVAAFQRFYTVVKAANSNITVGPIHMSYQWRPGSSTTATPDDWWVGSSFCDFIAVDSYWDTFNGPTATALQNDPQHMGWHNWASTKNKPLFVTERGVHPNGAAAAAVMLQDETWLKANGYVGFMYWDAKGNGGKTWIMDTDPDMSSAWQQIASRGRTS